MVRVKKGTVLQETHFKLTDHGADTLATLLLQRHSETLV